MRRWALGLVGLAVACSSSSSTTVPADDGGGDDGGGDDATGCTETLEAACQPLGPGCGGLTSEAAAVMALCGGAQGPGTVTQATSCNGFDVLALTGTDYATLYFYDPSAKMLVALGDEISGQPAECVGGPSSFLPPPTCMGAVVCSPSDAGVEAGEGGATDGGSVDASGG